MRQLRGRTLVDFLAEADGKPSKEWLKDLFHSTKVSGCAKRLAKELGVAVYTAWAYLRHYEVTRPGPGKYANPDRLAARAMSILEGTGYTTIEEAVRDLSKTMGSHTMGERLGVSPKITRRWMQEFGVYDPNRRTRGQTRRQSPRSSANAYKAAEVCTKWYTDKDGHRWSAQMVADKVGVTRASASYRIREWGIDRAIAFGKNEAGRTQRTSKKTREAGKA